MLSYGADVIRRSAEKRTGLVRVATSGLEMVWVLFLPEVVGAVKCSNMLFDHSLASFT